MLHLLLWNNYLSLFTLVFHFAIEFTHKKIKIIILCVKSNRICGLDFFPLFHYIFFCTKWYRKCSFSCIAFCTDSNCLQLFSKKKYLCCVSIYCMHGLRFSFGFFNEICDFCGFWLLFNVRYVVFQVFSLFLCSIFWHKFATLFFCCFSCRCFYILLDFGYLHTSAGQ